MGLIHSQGFDLCCRGLIYQAHLFEYINKLNGFNFSYICVWLFFFCRGLIYQAHIIFDFIKGMIDESNPCIKRRGGAQLIKPLLGKFKQKKGTNGQFLFFTLPDFEAEREEEDDDFFEALEEEDLDFDELELTFFELVPREELREERLLTDLLEPEILL